MDATQPQASTDLGVFDIDGTASRHVLHYRLVEALTNGGHIPRDSSVIELFEAWESYRNREILFAEFGQLLIRLTENGLFAGIHQDVYRGASRAIIETFGKHVYVFTFLLHRVLREAGYTTVALSGSPDEVVAAFAQKWGFHHFVATRFQFDANGRIRDGSAYLDVPAQRKGPEFGLLCEKFEADPQRTVAIGNTAGDAPMLKDAEYPFAFNPDQELEEIAWQQSWPTVLERVNTIVIFRRERRVAIETLLPPRLGAALRVLLAAQGITLRP